MSGDERGSVSILVAAVLVLLLVLGLCLADLAKVVIARAQAQVAADAAALAAAQDLAYPLAGVDPVGTAAVYAEANGATLTACGCTIDDPTRADVTVAHPVRPLTILGSVERVSATASAVVNAPAQE